MEDLENGITQQQKGMNAQEKIRRLNSNPDEFHPAMASKHRISNQLPEVLRHFRHSRQEAAGRDGERERYSGPQDRSRLRCILRSQGRSDGPRRL